MELLDSIQRALAAGRRPRSARRAGTVLAILVAGVLVLPSASGAAQPRADLDPAKRRAKLAELRKRADALAEQYGGRLVKLDDLKHDAERASARARRLDRRLAAARAQVAQLAAWRYKTAGAVRPATRLLLSDDPQGVLDQAATAQYLARDRSRKVQQLQPLLARAQRSRQAARSRVAELHRTIENLEDKKDKVQRLIARYESQLPEPPGGASGTPGNVTSRMATVYQLITQRFALPYGTHCYRPGSSGEHPEGRACDFMLSSGGAMPSSAGVQKGYAIAEWATANAERLGIMYVIYRQRIWDIRTGGGWESMEDRGSVTANHYDHVHISVF